MRAWPLPAVQGYMGHRDIATTMLYVHHVPRLDDAAKLSTVVAAQAPSQVPAGTERVPNG